MTTQTLMPATEVKTLVDQMNAMILEGQLLEAFEQFYAADVVMQDGAMEPWVGKELNREREKDFVSKITEFRGAHVGRVTAADGVTMCEWHFDYTHAEWGVQKYDQIAVQTWEDGKIVHERFYRAA